MLWVHVMTKSRAKCVYGICINICLSRRERDVPQFYIIVVEILFASDSEFIQNSTQSHTSNPTQKGSAIHIVIRFKIGIFLWFNHHFIYTLYHINNNSQFTFKWKSALMVSDISLSLSVPILNIGKNFFVKSPDIYPGLVSFSCFFFSTNYYYYLILVSISTVPCHSHSVRICFLICKYAD